MLHVSDYAEDLSMTIGVVSEDFEVLAAGRTFIPFAEMLGGQTGQFFLPDGFAVLAGGRHLNKGSFAKAVPTFTIIAKVMAVAKEGSVGGTEYELLFASFRDEQLGCTTLGLEQSAVQKNLVLHDMIADHAGYPTSMVDVAASLNRTSSIAMEKISLHPVGPRNTGPVKDVSLAGFMVAPTVGNDIRSLHLSIVGEGEFDIKRAGDQHRYIPNAWVSASRLLSDVSTFGDLCPWSILFIEALRLKQADWTPERAQGLTTIC